MIKNIRAEIQAWEGQNVPVFIMETGALEKAIEAYGSYLVAPLPINLPVMGNLPLEPGTIIPEDKLLRVELSFEDLLP
jgi:hypothetical protein